MPETETTIVMKGKQKTPAGGVKATVYYRDADGNPCPKDVAVKSEIVEYGEDGNILSRTYATNRPRSNP